MDHKKFIMTEELEQFLTENEYVELREIEGRGICGLRNFMFTIGLCYGLTEHDYAGRFCYPRPFTMDAIEAIKTWDGKGDPPGNWVKHKGATEYSNPLNKKDNEK
jgi:hypothetical protein